MLSRKKKLIFIDKKAVVENGVIIYPNVHIIGKCKIKKGTVIYPNSIIIDSEIGKDCFIKSSFLNTCVIENSVTIGPFANIREKSILKNNCKIGDFVEIKNSVIGENTKVSHMSYVGDCEIGDDCNIASGVVFCNYNGKIKQKSVIGNNCFIGSNCNIIAPVCVANKTYICAGSTLTKNTNEYDFVIARNRETIKENYAKKFIV